MVTAGAGATAVLSAVADNQMQISAGALLMLMNSAVVVGIGVLMFPVLRPHHEFAARAYLIARVFEAVLLAVGVICLLLLVPLAREYAEAGAGDASVLPALARVAQEGSQYSYQIAMIGLGLGSVLFCRVLLRANLVPRYMALWGMLGYAILAAGAMLEVLGYGVGVAMSVPGGLFEIALAALLMVKGFPTGRSQERAGLAHAV